MFIQGIKIVVQNGRKQKIFPMLKQRNINLAYENFHYRHHQIRNHKNIIRTVIQIRLVELFFLCKQIKLNRKQNLLQIYTKKSFYIYLGRHLNVGRIGAFILLTRF